MTSRTPPWLTFPLPEAWSKPAVVEDHVDVGGLRLFRAGLSSLGPRGEEIAGAAVHVDGPPLHRGYFELLERIGTREASHRRDPFVRLGEDGRDAGVVASSEVFRESPSPTYRYSTSNGIALHDDWSSARARAHWELAERDRVLRAWYGESRPHPLPLGERLPIRNLEEYEWAAYSFPESTTTDLSKGVHVVGLFGFPLRDERSLVSGYCARPDRDEALTGAIAEALQQLAFLWDEPVRESIPSLAPTPMFHLERWQHRRHHDALRSWLDGGHLRYGRAERTPSRAETTPSLFFIDLTPTWMPGGLRVAKALSGDALPLIFGESPFARHLPTALRHHPIA